MLKNRRGFTLIELMIVVAVIGILAMIALPKMSKLIQKSNEAGTQGQLGAVRSAIHIYFLDNSEFYPTDLTVVLAPGSKYYSGVRPVVFTDKHGRRSTIQQITTLGPTLDTGSWGFVKNDPLSTPADIGTFWIECTHTNLSGKVWSQY